MFLVDATRHGLYLYPRSMRASSAEQSFAGNQFLLRPPLGDEASPGRFPFRVIDPDLS